MIFVTGGTGLVGSHLLQELIKQGKQVKALYRNVIPETPFKEKIHWVRGDILDVMALEEYMEGVNEVYHCAAIVSFNPKARAEMLKVNVEGTINVINTCLVSGVEKLCYVSSVAALGRIRNNQEVDETMSWSEETSNSNYGKSKHLAEVEVWRGISEGLNAVIVNPVIILGAGDWGKGSSAIFKSAYNEFPWYTEGVSGFVDVADVVKAMMQLTENSISGQRFILSEGNYSYKEVFTLIANSFGKKPPHKKVTPFMAALVWRLEGIKARFIGKDPLLTRETARTAQAVVHFTNTKLSKFLPHFAYTPLHETIKRVCEELESPRP
jgi:nucleoside-diphosphate-sugar epimerase